MKTTPILGFDLSAQKFDEAIDRLLVWAQDWDTPRYALSCASYTVTIANFREDMRQALYGADMLPADGMPLVWLQRQRGMPEAERVYAPDVMERVCELTAKLPITHYLWGGEPQVTEKLVDTLQTRFPDIQIAGYYTPPIAPLETKPIQAVIDRINTANPHIVWVCLGSVKQDLWMSMYRPYLKAPLIMSVGAAFNFISGSVPQAPPLMQRNGLEWLFRLIVEPRLIARYFIFNPIFLALVLKETLFGLQATPNTTEAT